MREKNYENEYADEVFSGYVTTHECDEIENFLEDSGNQYVVNTDKVVPFYLGSKVFCVTQVNKLTDDEHFPFIISLLFLLVLPR